MYTPLAGPGATLPRRVVLRVLWWLACAFTAPVAAKPIPLAQALDLRDQRVLVVALSGSTAGAYSVGKWYTFSSSKDRGAAAALAIDALSASAAVERLREIGIDAQVLDHPVDETDIYGDPERWFNLQTSREWKLNEIAAALLDQHRPRALLVLSRGEFQVHDNGPILAGYGVWLGQKAGSAYFTLQSRLYVSGRKKPLVKRIGGTLRQIEGVAAEPALAFPQPEVWLRARPVLEDLTRKVTRTLAAQTVDRAARPPAQIGDKWESIYAREYE